MAIRPVTLRRKRRARQLRLKSSIPAARDVVAGKGLSPEGRPTPFICSTPIAGRTLLASIPCRSAADALSRRVPTGFLYPRARGRRNALARRCALTVSGAGPRSDHRINCRRCEQCFAHCLGEGPAARRPPQIGIGLAARFAVGRRLLSLNYLRVIALVTKLKSTLVTLTARAECCRSTVIRGRQNVYFERSN